MAMTAMDRTLGIMELRNMIFLQVEVKDIQASRLVSSHWNFVIQSSSDIQEEVWRSASFAGPFLFVNCATKIGMDEATLLLVAPSRGLRFMYAKTTQVRFLINPVVKHPAAPHSQAPFTIEHVKSGENVCLKLHLLPAAFTARASVQNMHLTSPPINRVAVIGLGDKLIDPSGGQVTNNTEGVLLDNETHSKFPMDMDGPMVVHNSRGVTLGNVINAMTEFFKHMTYMLRDQIGDVELDPGRDFDDEDLLFQDLQACGLQVVFGHMAD